MAYQKHQGRLWKAIGPKIATRVYCLFGDIKKHLATVALTVHHGMNSPRQPKMGKEIQLEARTQIGLVQFGDSPLVSVTGIRDRNINPAKLLSRCFRDSSGAPVIGQIDREAPNTTADCRKRCVQSGLVLINQQNLAAC